MTTSQVIKAWTVPTNFCEPRGDYYFNLHRGAEEVSTKQGKHDQYFLMDLGRKLPSTKLHAKYWLNGCKFDLIGTHDILPMEDYFKMIGFTPDYRFAKSGCFVRLNNHDELNIYIKNYFKI